MPREARAASSAAAAAPSAPVACRGTRPSPTAVGLGGPGVELDGCLAALAVSGGQRLGLACLDQKFLHGGLEKGYTLYTMRGWWAEREGLEEVARQGRAESWSGMDA